MTIRNFIEGPLHLRIHYHDVVIQAAIQWNIGICNVDAGLLVRSPVFTSRFWLIT